MIKYENVVIASKVESRDGYADKYHLVERVDAIGKTRRPVAWAWRSRVGDSLWTTEYYCTRERDMLKAMGDFFEKPNKNKYNCYTSNWKGS